MDQSCLEERIALLELQMAQLQKGDANGAVSKGWRSSVGMFTGDEIMKQIDHAARKLRDADRRRARRASTSRARAKK